MKLRIAFASVVFLVFCSSVYGVQVSLPEITTESGSVITVEISLDDAAGLAAADLTMEYDPEVLGAVEARTAALTTGFLMASNLDVPGEVVFSMAGLPGIEEGSGAILEVDFEAIAAGPVTSSIILTEVALFSESGESIDATIVNGNITIKGEDVTASGKLTELGITTFMYGTHGLFDGDDLLYALESSTLALNDFADENVIIQGTLMSLGFDGGPTLLEVFAVEVEEPPGPPVVREHEIGSPIIALEATYDEADTHGHTYIDIWSGEMLIEEGMFLEFQVAMFSGNPTFKGTVDLHASDGSTLRDSGTVDQNGVNVHPAEDISEYARDMWYHRQISLDALAGKTLDGVMIATDSNEHLAGMFRVYADNIQITNGEYILLSIYADEDTIPITGETTATGTTFAGTAGMSNFMASIVGATPVAPAGKLISSWGSIKNMR